MARIRNTLAPGTAAILLCLAGLCALLLFGVFLLMDDPQQRLSHPGEGPPIQRERNTDSLGPAHNYTPPPMPMPAPETPPEAKPTTTPS